MKISSFHPMIATKDADATVKMLEELGFEKRHEKKDLDGEITSYVRMKDPEGHCVDVGNLVDSPKDYVSITMNVDDFEEAYDFLIARGFKPRVEDKVVESRSSKAMIMISPSGYAIGLVKHIK